MKKKILYTTMATMLLVIGGLGTFIVTDLIEENNEATATLESKKIKEPKEEEAVKTAEEKIVEELQTKFFKDNMAYVTHSEEDGNHTFHITALSNEMLEGIEDQKVWEEKYRPLMEEVSMFLMDEYDKGYTLKLVAPNSDGKANLVTLVDGVIEEDLFPYTVEEVVVEEPVEEPKEEVVVEPEVVTEDSVTEYVEPAGVENEDQIVADIANSLSAYGTAEFVRSSPEESWININLYPEQELQQIMLNMNEGFIEDVGYFSTDFVLPIQEILVGISSKYPNVDINVRMNAGDISGYGIGWTNGQIAYNDYATDY